MNISLLFFSILGGLSVALIAFMPLVPQRKIGKGFFRFNIFLSILFLLCLYPLSPFSNFLLPIQRAAQITPSANLLSSVVVLYFLFTVFIFFLFYQFGKLPDRNVNPLIYIAAIFLGITAPAF